MASNLILDRVNGFEMKYACINYNGFDQRYSKQTFQQQSQSSYGERCQAEVRQAQAAVT
jgi:hypothetical protein